MIATQKRTVGLNEGGRPKTSTTEEPVSDDRPTLAQVGIDKKLSSRSQAIASIPEDDFEETLAEHREQTCPWPPAALETVIQAPERPHKRR